MSRQQTSYYPLFVDLTDRRCVVVGGGPIAQRKVALLLRCGARVAVISPALTARLQAHARAWRIDHRARRFRPTDLEGAWLVFAATDDQAINEAVSRTARRLRVFANIVDQAALCTFIAPAIYMRGPLTVAVSTGGGSPALAKRLRDEAARTAAQGYAPMLALLASLRGRAKRRLNTYQSRKRYFESLVQGRVFTLVRAGQLRRARVAALQLLDRCAARNGTP